MIMNYGLLLDSMIVVLLAATIVYAFILNKRLQALRNNRSELEQAARSFAEAAQRADDSIKSLRSVSDGAGAELREQIHRAQSLRDEMKFLVEAGDALADRLEGAASSAVDGRKDGRNDPRGERPRRGDRTGASGAGGKSNRDDGGKDDGRRAGAGGGAGGQVMPLRARSESASRRPAAPGAPGADEGAREAPQSRDSARSRGRGDVDLLKAIENMR